MPKLLGSKSGPVTKRGPPQNLTLNYNCLLDSFIYSSEYKARFYGETNCWQSDQTDPVRPELVLRTEKYTLQDSRVVSPIVSSKYFI